MSLYVLSTFYVIENGIECNDIVKDCIEYIDDMKQYIKKEPLQYKTKMSRCDEKIIVINWERSMEAAAEDANVEAVKFFSNKITDFDSAIYIMSSKGYSRQTIEYINYLTTNKKTWIPDWNLYLEAAVESGNQELIGFYTKNGANNWLGSMWAAAEYGHYDLTKFFYDKRDDWSQKDLETGMVYLAQCSDWWDTEKQQTEVQRNIDKKKWFYYRDNKKEEDSEEDINEKNKLKALQQKETELKQIYDLLEENIGNIDEATYKAAKIGNMPFIQHILNEADFDLDFDETMFYAGKYGHMDIIFELGNEFYDEYSDPNEYERGLEGAIIGSQYKIIKFYLYSGFNIHTALKLAIDHKNQDVVAFIKKYIGKVWISKCTTIFDRMVVIQNFPSEINLETTCQILKKECQCKKIEIRKKRIEIREGEYLSIVDTFLVRHNIVKIDEIINPAFDDILHGYTN